MNELWQRIELWLSENAPLVLHSLRSGAAEKDIASAEVAIGRSFPADYRECLSRHEGQELNQYGSSPGFLYGLNMHPLSKLLFGVKMIDDLLQLGLGGGLEIRTHGPVRPVWWDRLWVPIADDGNGNYCCLDLNPAEGGHIGQIIQVWNESHFRAAQSKSFFEWLTVFSDRLEAGEYVYSEAHNGLISLEDAIADGVVRP